MKTVCILLLGFGGLLPYTCSKSEKKKTSEVQVNTKSHVALFAPLPVQKQPRKTV
jgi:hypothetical protein